MECRKNRGQCERCGIVGEADAEAPRATVRNKLHAANSVVNLLEYVARLEKELGTRRCKPGETVSLSRKQAEAHLLFEPGDLFGERRLRDLQPICGATEIQLLGDDDEIPEMPKLNIAVPDIVRQTGFASRTRLSCSSHLCHCQLNPCARERRPQFDEDHLACAVPLHRTLNRSGSKDDRL
jgi:hypothetical protein